MSFRKIMSIVIICLVITLSSCKQSNQLTSSDADFTAFQTEEGEYTFPGLEWGSSPKETEKVLRTSLDGPLEGWSTGTRDLYRLVNFHEIDERGIFTLLEFSDNRLDTISFKIKGDSDLMDELYDNISQTMVEAYGEGNPIVDHYTEQKSTTGTTFNQIQWRNDTDERITFLFVSKTEQEGFYTEVTVATTVTELDN